MDPYATTAAAPFGLWPWPDAMSADAPSPITALLRDWQLGNEQASNQLAALVCDELRRLASVRLRGERRDHTLDATALVNEAWLRLGDQHADWQSRGHFFGIAARMMRRILVDHARRRRAAKRGEGAGAVSVDEIEPLLVSPLPDERLLALDEALARLASIDPRQARVVELRYFAGLSIADTGRALGISPMTVKREWASARAWLYDAVQGDRG